jgi:NAD(P)H dehydrogenase (quinone)
VIAASAGEGRIVGATRADLADAAAVVLLEDGHLGQVYELSGDEAFGFAELAAAASEVLGREVVYTPLTTEQHVAALQSAGLDAGVAGFVTALDAGIAAGVLEVPTGGVSRLTGRPTTPLVEGLRAALATEHAAA